MVTGKVRTDSVFDVLNTEIEKRPQYSNRKEAKIAEIRKEFKSATTDRDRLDSCLELFTEYRCYQSDSAYRYAVILDDISSRGADKSAQALARLCLFDYYTSVGFFKEASEIKERIVASDLPVKYLPSYYILCNRYFQNIAGYVGGTNTLLGAEYNQQRLACLDSLISVLDRNTGSYQLAVLERKQLDHPSPAEDTAERLRILDRYELSDHDKAVQYSILGRAAMGNNEPDEAKYYLALSAIHDIRGDIKETTSAKMLGELLFSEKNLDEAYKLIHIAFDDASFYNSHLRKDETSNVMRMIEIEHHNKMRGTIWSIGLVLGAIVLLLAGILFLLYKIRKKSRELHTTNEALKKKSEEVDRVNHELKEAIDQLQEVTDIKDEYIMQSLYVNTSFVNGVEQKCQEVLKKLKEKKYDSLKYLPYEMGIKEERARIYRSFDKAFLSLFPNFISSFNELFDPEDRWLSPDSQELPVEVRIFALLRLGISDTQEVAKYLNLSVKTIYVYKTKVKSKSAVENSEFEAKIMAIAKK